jgi:tungstate transport system permease protein
MKMPPQWSEIGSIIALTVQVSGTAVLMSSAVGIPLGVGLGLSRTRFQPWMAALVHTGMALPPVVVGLLLYLLLSRSGPLAFLGWLFTPQAMIAAQVLLALPFVTGVTMNWIAGTDPELYPQMRSLGASDWQCRWAVVREARRGLCLAVVMALGRSISEVGAVLIVGGNIEGHTRVLTTAIVLETGKGRFELALALGGVLLLLAWSINLCMIGVQGTKWRV